MKRCGMMVMRSGLLGDESNEACSERMGSMLV